MARYDDTRLMWSRHIGYRWALVNNAVLAAYFGITAMLSPGRFAAATYDGLNRSLGIAGWGALLLSYGVALTVCAWLPKRIVRAVFLLGTFFYVFIAVTFAVGLSDDHASPWSMVFLSLGAWQAQQRAAYVQDDPL